MHIKQVTIEGFKSYKEQTIADPFSPKINLIVGANGSGKSNFFHAIRFVIADLFTTLRQEERVALLHESTGPNVPSAYVEVLFDNNDKRIPIDRDEVRVRRTISAKKDEYMIDKKHVTKKEVADMLESAGFSKANPYYVVQQGKIMQMAKMTDEARLNLLKEIGGAGTYEERRKESMKYLQETEAKTVQIDEMLADMDARLKDLEAERKELEEYQEADRTRRCAEYALLDVDMSKTNAELEELEGRRAEALQERERRQTAASAAVREVERLGEAIQAAEQRANDGGKAKEAAQEELQSAVANRVSAEAHCKELEVKVHDDNFSREHMQLELDQTQVLVRKTEGQLEGIQQQLEEATNKEADLQQAIQDKELRQAELCQKQGQQQQFSSKKERDDWCKRQIAENEAIVKSHQKNQQKAEKEAHDHETRTGTLTKQRDDLEAKLKREEEVLGEHVTAVRQAEQEHVELTQSRMEIRRNLDQLQSEVQRLEDQEKSISDDVHSSIPRDVNRGMRSVARLVKERNIQGVHGPVFQLFQCKTTESHRAVEVIAGNMLYNIVVDNADVATTLARLLNKEKGGRVTFLPLTTIRGPDSLPPKTKDATPLVSLLKPNLPIYQKVLEHVFGKTMLCRSMEIASALSDEGHYDCVTLNGEKFTRHGTVSGGGTDQGKKGKLTLMYQMLKVRAELDEKHQGRQALEYELQEADQHAVQLNNKKNKLENERRACKEASNSLRQDMNDLGQQIKRLQQDREQCLKNATRYQTEADKARAQKASFEAMLSTPLNARLSPEEHAELKALNPELTKLKQQLAKQQDALSGLQRRQKQLAMELENSRNRVTELEDQVSQALQAVGDEDVVAARRALDVAKQSEAAARERTQELGKQISKLKNEIADLTKKQAQQQELADNTVDASDHKRYLEELDQTKVELTEKLQEIRKKLRDLGTLPADAYQKYRGMRAKELHRLHKKAQQQLSALSHVNKKALNQYTLFMEQREEVMKRRKQQELDGGKIKELINVLDMRKNEALQRTVKSVGQNFQEVFTALVPGGKGSLKMVLNTETEGPGGSTSARPNEQTYSGVKVKVSFGAGDVVSMNVLSGGQKTLVALALILAIQRCDPAPFYLFDEIDAALDPHYRTTVAEMLRRQADDKTNQCQFIITTFNTQLVGHADKIYGVAQRNRISKVDVITKEAALQFLAQEDQQAQNGNGTQENGNGSEGAGRGRDKRKRAA